MTTTNPKSCSLEKIHRAEILGVSVVTRESSLHPQGDAYLVERTPNGIFLAVADGVTQPWNKIKTSILGENPATPKFVGSVSNNPPFHLAECVTKIAYDYYSQPTEDDISFQQYLEQKLHEQEWIIDTLIFWSEIYPGLENLCIATTLAGVYINTQTNSMKTLVIGDSIVYGDGKLLVGEHPNGANTTSAIVVRIDPTNNYLIVDFLDKNGQRNDILTPILPIPNELVVTTDGFCDPYDDIACLRWNNPS